MHVQDISIYLICIHISPFTYIQIVLMPSRIISYLLPSHHLPSRLSTLLVHPPHLHFPLRGNISPSGPHVLSLTTAIVSSPTLSYSPTRSYSHSKIFPSPLQHSPRASYQVVSSENRGIVILQANPPKYVRPPAKPSLFPPFTKSRG
jgi:hypothetical protein